MDGVLRGQGGRWCTPSVAPANGTHAPAASPPTSGSPASPASPHHVKQHDEKLAAHAAAAHQATPGQHSLQI